MTVVKVGRDLPCSGFKVTGCWRRN